MFQKSVCVCVWAVTARECVWERTTYECIVCGFACGCCDAYIWWWRRKQDARQKPNFIDARVFIHPTLWISLQRITKVSFHICMFVSPPQFSVWRNGPSVPTVLLVALSLRSSAIICVCSLVASLVYSAHSSRFAHPFFSVPLHETEAVAFLLCAWWTFIYIMLETLFEFSLCSVPVSAFFFPFTFAVEQKNEQSISDSTYTHVMHMQCVTSRATNK